MTLRSLDFLEKGTKFHFLILPFSGTLSFLQKKNKIQYTPTLFYIYYLLTPQCSNLTKKINAFVQEYKTVQYSLF